MAEQGLSPALALLRLTSRYGNARVEAASKIALASQVRSPVFRQVDVCRKSAKK